MSSVRSWPYVPRTPSVPKRRPTSGSALRVLRRLARFLEPVLAALLCARVARQEAPLLQVAAKRGVGLDQRARNAVPHSAGLPADPAAVDRRDHVVAIDGVRQPQWLRDDHLQRRPREIVLQRAAVQREAARSGDDPHTRHGLLATSGRANGFSQCCHQRLSSLASYGFGSCDACGCSGPSYTFSFLAIARPSRLCGSMPFTARSTASDGLSSSSLSYPTRVRPPGYPEWPMDSFF